MTNRLDPQQLEQVWDASVLGRTLPLLVEDPEELRLLDLLAEVDRPAASPAFFRGLERELAIGVTIEEIPADQARLPVPVPPADPHSARLRLRPPTRTTIPAYALVAVALLLILSTAVIALPRPGSESERSIPAVSTWLDDGPPTSAGLQSKTLFAHAFTADELTNYQSDKWGWIEFSRSSAVPANRRATIAGSDPSDSSMSPSVVVIEVETGILHVSLKGPAVLSHDASGISEQIDAPAEIMLNAGDAITFRLDALDQIWNPTTETATYISGGLYADPTSPTFSFIDGTVLRHTGISLDQDLFAGVSSLDVTIEQIAIDPGETFAYTTTPDSLLLADITGGGLRKQRWVGGAQDGAAVSLVSSTYWLSSESPGYYTLTNTSSQPVDVYIFGVAPVQIDAESPVPAAMVDTLFSKTLTSEEMALYESDNWKWISLSQGTLQPGDQAITVVGSPTANDIGFSLNGLGVITVIAGELVANTASGAVVERGATGTIEPVDRRADVTLEAGDNLIAPARTMPAIWNRSDVAATYLAGGVYIKRSFTPLNELDFDFMRGGITVHPGDLATGAPVTMSLQQVTIPPGGSYSYTVSPATWLEAIVSGGELRQEKMVEGTPQGKPKSLLVSHYSLHSGGSGDYVLTNDGSGTVEISFFRVEAQSASTAAPSPTASLDSESEQQGS